jgi:hypothetical protein
MTAARALALIAAFAVACSKPSESTDAKRTPKPPPPASGEIAGALHIDVEIDGAPAAPIDAARLAVTKPDYQNEEHRAWKIATLLGPGADLEGAVVSATGEKGLTISVPRPTSATDPTAVLVVNRRGDVMVATVSPDEPFPPYHGRGGRLNRPGDHLPRVEGVTKISVGRR